MRTIRRIAVLAWVALLLAACGAQQATQTAGPIKRTVSGKGTFTVPETIPAGTWSRSGADELCIWLLEGEDGRTVNGGTGASLGVRVVLRDGQRLKLNAHCGTWTLL